MSGHTPFKLSVVDNHDLNDAFWLVLETQDDIQSGCSIAEVRHGDDIIGDERANAERLALCWNMHDELVEALNSAFGAMNYMGDVLNGMDAVEPQDEAAVTPAFKAVRAALAKAHEGSPS